MDIQDAQDKPDAPWEPDRFTGASVFILSILFIHVKNLLASCRTDG
jgi:hypothetical protein